MRYLETSFVHLEQPIARCHYREIGGLLRSETAAKRMRREYKRHIGVSNQLKINFAQLGVLEFLMATYVVSC
jgi:hypothetical protein